MLQFFSQLLLMFVFTLPSFKNKTCKQKHQSGICAATTTTTTTTTSTTSTTQWFIYPPTFQVVAPTFPRPSRTNPAHQRSLSGPYSLGEAPTPGQRRGEAPKRRWKSATFLEKRRVPGNQRIFLLWASRPFVSRSRSASKKGIPVDSYQWNSTPGTKPSQAIQEIPPKKASNFGAPKTLS